MGLRQLFEWVAAGTIAGELLACSRTTGDVSALAGIGVAAALIVLARRSEALVVSAATFAAFAGGIVLAGRATAVPSDPSHVAHLPLPLATRVHGRVIVPPEPSGGDALVVVDIDAVEIGGRERATWGRVRLRVRGAGVGSGQSGVAGLSRGRRLAVETTLRRPRNFANPGGFDAVGALARRGVHVVGAVRDAATIEVGAAPEPTVTGIVDRWRGLVRTAMADVTDPDARAVLQALVIGDESTLAPDLRRAFTRAGVVHVLSVSGLHVGIVAGAAALAIGWALRRSERVLLGGHARKLALTASLVPASVYAALAGFEIATFRSIAMAAAVAAAALLERQAGALRALSLAALVAALAVPGSPAEISYQLSFASVVSLIAGASGLSGRSSRVTQGVRLTLAAWIGTAPLTAFHFHQVSLVAVVANPVVIPLFGAMALLPALAGALLALWSLGIAGWAFAMAALPVRVGVEIVRAIGGWEWAALDVPLPTVGEVLLLYMVMAGAVLRRRQPFRVVGVAALCCLATDVGWWASERSAPHLRATFLDVGQGDASVVELPGGRVLVVDAGGFAGSEFDTGAAIVEPFLRSRKIQSIDALVMSHAHPDHAAGLAHLVRAFAPSELWWTGDGGEGAAWAETVRALRETGTPARRLRAGDALVDYPEVEVLHPPRGWAAPSLNDGSLVLRVRDGATAIVLAGDAERRAETTMVDDARPLAATVLKVPHHGSRTSSTWPFVRAVGPVIAVASLGADNRFGHPAPEVAARYEAIGTRWLRTDRCGAVRVVGDGWQVVATAMRRDCESIRTPPRP